VTATTAGGSSITSSSNDAMLSGTGPITVPGGQKLVLQCFNDDNYNMKTLYPIEVMATPIRTTNAATGTFSRVAVPLR
jgi:hypothetical protein